MIVMSDHLETFIEDLKQRNHGIFSDDDFDECREAVTDIAQMIQKLDATQVKFRKKLTDFASQHPPDKEKVVYLQGMVDGLNLAIKPLQTHYGPIHNT
jgi:hypothetical protein